MAQLVVGTIGAVVGFAVGGPMGARIGWTLGAMVGSTLGPKQKSEGPKLADLRVTGTEYGQTIPWVAGSPRIPGQIVWASDRRPTATTQSQGGKGSGPSSEYTSYTYDVDLLVLLTENQIDGVGRIWLNSALVYDGNTRRGTWNDLRIYLGTDDQLPDPTYEAAVGIGNAPAYRGRAYVFIQGLQLGSNGSIPNMTFEVSRSEATIFPKTFIFREIFGNRFRDELNEPFPFNTTINEPLVPQFYNFLPNPAIQFDLSANPTNGFSRVSYTSIRFRASEYADKRYVIEFDFLGFTPLLNTGGTFLNGSPEEGNVIFEIREFTGPLTIMRLITTRSTLNGPVVLKAWTSITSASAVETRTVRVLGDLSNFIGKKLGFVKLANTNGTYDFYPSVDGVALFSTPMISNPIIVGVPSPTITISIGINIRPGQPGPTADPNHLLNITYANLVSYTQTQPDSNPDVDVFTIPLPRCVDQLMQRANYSTDDYDVSLLSPEDLVRGMALTQVASTRSALEVLQAAFFFEAAKGEKIVFKPRSATVDAAIKYEDLAARESNTGEPEPFPLVINNDMEIPSQIGLTYANTLADFQNATEYSERVFVSQDAVNLVQLPLGLLPSEAKRIANAMLNDQITSRATATIDLPIEYARLEPSDVILVETPERTYRMRIVKKTDANNILKFDVVADDANVLLSSSLTDGDYNSQLLQQIGDTSWLTLDVPIFSDGANAPGYYVVARNAEPDELWPGAVFLRSFDNVSYSQVQQFVVQSVFGTCNNILGNWTGGNVYDEINFLEVQVLGQLSGRTRQEMQADTSLNVAIVGDEVIRFRNAELIAANTYRLSGLLRGFRGTEWAQGLHTAGERFVLVDQSFRRVSTDVNQINQLKYVKAVTVGLNADGVTEQEFTDTGVGLRPFSVSNLRVLADGADVQITWQRRTRLNVSYGGPVDQVVPLGEDIERYQVRILNGTTLVRTATVFTPSFTYTQAQIAADGFTSGQVITAEVAQVSATVGLGIISTSKGIAP